MSLGESGHTDDIDFADDEYFNELAEGEEHEHEHDPEHCGECQEKAAEENQMKMAMGGFVLFFVVLFVMYLMLRSCKNKKE